LGERAILPTCARRMKGVRLILNRRQVRGELVQRTATLNVPRGVGDGHVIRLAGWGGSRAARPAQCGDLVLEIVVDEDDVVMV
jgi:hypothetical protein